MCVYRFRPEVCLFRLSYRLRGLVMGITEKYVVGVLRGLDQEELAELIDDTPGLAGRKTGQFLRALLDGGVANLTAVRAGELKDLIAQDAEAEQALMQSIVRFELKKEETEDILTIYQSALNFVCSVIAENGRSVILQGFLHSPNVWSYWEYEPAHSDILFQKKGRHLFPGTSLTVSIAPLEEADNESGSTTPTTERTLRDWNLAIRKASDGKFKPAQSSRWGHEIKHVEEFKILMSDPWGINRREVDIPDGAPGLLGMFASLPIAMEAQGHPRKKLEETMQKLHPFELQKQRS